MNSEELRALVGQSPAIVNAARTPDGREIVKYIIEEDMAEMCQVLLEHGCDAIRGVHALGTSVGVITEKEKKRRNENKD